METAHAGRRKAVQKRRGGDPAAARIVRALREEILTRREGDFLGSEDDLLSRYGVSRPTFRQTVRVLENEQLLTVKRGIGGGYYARRPTIQSAGRAAATFLRSRGTTLRHLLDASSAANRALVRLAALSNDERARAELRRHLETLRARPTRELSITEFNAIDSETAARLGALCGNPPLELFINTLYQVGMDEARLWIFDGHPERIEEYYRLRIPVIQAILAGDPEVADLLFERLGRQMRSWLKDLETEAPARPPAQTGEVDESRPVSACREGV